jgi:hypothetical protein
MAAGGQPGDRLTANSSDTILLHLPRKPLNANQLLVHGLLHLDQRIGRTTQLFVEFVRLVPFADLLRAAFLSANQTWWLASQCRTSS